ncbi:MAG: hypothetical protein IIZ43_01810, partial [Eubacterium sp.]|nr:hypothetical protein [Eubacterium sp.]
HPSRGHPSRYDAFSVAALPGQPRAVMADQLHRKLVCTLQRVRIRPAVGKMHIDEASVTIAVFKCEPEQFINVQGRQYGSEKK